MENDNLSPNGTDNSRKSKRGGISDRIYNQLKKQILKGEIESGTLLSESEIARRFSVSRTPVRDALNRLSCDHITVSLPQKGHQVRTVSVDEAMGAYRVREILEAEAASEAARRITDEQIAYLKSLVSGREVEKGLAHYQIHSTIAKISGNRLLADFIEEALTLMEQMIANHPITQLEFQESLKPEMLVIEAIETRDPKVAREAMRQHIRDSRENQFQFEFSN